MEIGDGEWIVLYLFNKDLGEAVADAGVSVCLLWLLASWLILVWTIAGFWRVQSEAMVERKGCWGFLRMRAGLAEE